MMENNENDFPDFSVSLNILPYQFEPLLSNNNQEGSDDTASGSSNDDDAILQREEGRLGNTEWCDCGYCQVMNSATECLCCDEVEILNEKKDDLRCITLHESFIANCLNRHVLEVSMYEYLEHQGPLDDNEPIHETYRHIAYRRFVTWIWHRLGRHNRKVLPSCVVSKIREAFPSEVYVGFKYARP